ncbi:hypothetical protein P8C59_008690 [Phyllachora maydis]|uniref:Uncharacterized protein n=1 Tax=Phyllachora maydis TaxID=1825666 RepID=A0AAD9IBM3_9PEZI|nr:hypothetical protein P8C59_008690 [Phyllachora maydis]
MQTAIAVYIRIVLLPALPVGPPVHSAVKTAESLGSMAPIAGSAIGTREPFLTADAAARSSQEDQAFNDAFKAFDDCEFQHEMAQWMAEHGPGEAAHANQDVQQLAEDLETRLTAGDTSVPLQEREEGDELAQQHELAKAAQSILDTVAGNENPKFKKSVFMSTMRRIAAYEVVAKDYDLVDAKTGDSIVTGAIVDEEAKERTEDSKVAVGVSDRVNCSIFPELRIYRFWELLLGPHLVAMAEVDLLSPAQFSAFVP